MTLAVADFETYSEAGYVYDHHTDRWRSIAASGPGGLIAVGVHAYAEHPTTEVLTLTYNVGAGERLWTPYDPPPADLLDHVANGGLLEFWNSYFDFCIWSIVCTRKYHWPDISLESVRCAMAKSRAWTYPGALANAAVVLNTPVKKAKDGKRLLTKFSRPRNPTKRDTRLRIMPLEDKDGLALISYNLDDIRSQAQVSARLPELSPTELAVWQLDQRINHRGIHIDRESMDACIELMDREVDKYEQELHTITDGAVATVNETQNLKEWIAFKADIRLGSLDADAVSATMETLDPWDPVYRALEIRQGLALASTKKLVKARQMLSSDSRLRETMGYHVARTGRFAGRGIQPQNMPRSGPELYRCHECKHVLSGDTPCRLCGGLTGDTIEWGPEAVEAVLYIIRTRDPEYIAKCLPMPLKAVSGCLRGIITAAPGHELIASDYSAIEAVILAVLSGEEWRLEVFRTHGRIYEETAARITGVPMSADGSKHPSRMLGKLAELASGFGGWVGAWRSFGADAHFSTEQELKRAILAWRDASPAIVEFWGGQVRKVRGVWEWYEDLHGIEGAVVKALQNPGMAYTVGQITVKAEHGILGICLPSGRWLTYHEAELVPTICRRSKLPSYLIRYKGWNSNPRFGAVGWTWIETYGGKLVENIVQAVARDILVYAMLRIDAAGYPIVLHVHDEIIAEVPEGTGDVAEFERLMLPVEPWAAGWPIKASGGYRALRYRKG